MALAIAESDGYETLPASLPMLFLFLLQLSNVYKNSP